MRGSIRFLNILPEVYEFFILDCPNEKGLAFCLSTLLCDFMDWPKDTFSEWPAISSLSLLLTRMTYLLGTRTLTGEFLIVSFSVSIFLTFVNSTSLLPRKVSMISKLICGCPCFFSPSTSRSRLCYLK